MTQEDFKKLHQAEKIIGSQKKLDLQIKNLKNCKVLKMVYTDSEDNKTYHFDIQANDVTGSPIEYKAKQFIDEYIQYLNSKKSDLQDLFDKL